MTGSTPHFSILIPLVSSVDRGLILEVLDALRDQAGNSWSYEAVLPDRRDDEISARIRRDYSEARLIRVPVGTPIPAMLTQALSAARGNWVAVTEDHCIPSVGWLNAFAVALRNPEVAAVGGPVRNAAHTTLLDRATFFCEYLAFHGHGGGGEGVVQPGGLAGMNFCCRRSDLSKADPTRLASEFWERSALPALTADGGSLFMDHSAMVRHAKSFPLSLFLHQRYLYSRAYAGLQLTVARRMVHAFLAPLLIPLLIMRHGRAALGSRGLFLKWLATVPLQLLFYTAWAWGEVVGAAWGPGDALGRIE
ncbi:MAG: glycosyltransferase family A protein [Planctomycetota bacterium]|jgi:hypothetical protein|nr:glycosyltransferase family A protein [Planctomycetota bacterium]MDP6938543.1 glycosyltransferase family A protein [Planctomycetota bacterium]